jgi:preprotein translocase subunit SecA
MGPAARHLVGRMNSPGVHMVTVYDNVAERCMSFWMDPASQGPFGRT